MAWEGSESQNNEEQFREDESIYSAIRFSSRTEDLSWEWLIGCTAHGLSPRRGGGRARKRAMVQRYNTHVPSTRTDQIQLLRLLVSRLERLPVDSHWARRASGLRGNIVKVLEEADSDKEVSASRLELMTEAAFVILRRAAQDIPDLEELLKRK